MEDSNEADAHALKVTRLLGEAAAAKAELDLAPEGWRRWWRESGAAQLRCILMTAWDPIGVSNIVEHWDEYDQYLPGVGNLLRRAPADEPPTDAITDYLEHVEQDFMGLRLGRRDFNESIAAAIVTWYAWTTGDGSATA